MDFQKLFAKLRLREVEYSIPPGNPLLRFDLGW